MIQMRDKTMNAKFPDMDSLTSMLEERVSLQDEINSGAERDVEDEIATLDMEIGAEIKNWIDGLLIDQDEKRSVDYHKVKEQIRDLLPDDTPEEITDRIFEIIRMKEDAQFHANRDAERAAERNLHERGRK